MDIVFPTTGSAVIELKQPDYNILQLAKQVDSAVKTRQDQDAGQLGQDPHSELGGSHKHSKYIVRPRRAGASGHERERK